MFESSNSRKQGSFDELGFDGFIESGCRFGQSYFLHTFSKAPLLQRSNSLNLHVIGILGNGVTSAQTLVLHTYTTLIDPGAYESYFSYRRASHLVVEYSSFRGFTRNASWRRFES